MLYRLIYVNVSGEVGDVEAVMAGGRDAELAGRLREAAVAGQTALALNLLEQGAPFIVDTVSLLVSSWLKWMTI